MIPLSVEFAIREAVKLLRLSRRNFKSRQVTNGPPRKAQLLTMTPADLFERYWSRARRILVVALLVLGALLALAGYLILA